MMIRHILSQELSEGLVYKSELCLPGEDFQCQSTRLGLLYPGSDAIVGTHWAKQFFSLASISSTIKRIHEIVSDESIRYIAGIVITGGIKIQHDFSSTSHELSIFGQM
jgi:hypothetical protein